MLPSGNHWQKALCFKASCIVHDGISGKNILQ